jgi:micrococcal nuclease
MYEYRAELVRVIDGDTVDLEVDLGFHLRQTIRVRLKDVDTPEIHGVKHNSDEYAAGLKAKQFVENWFKGASDLCVQTSKTGKYGRWLGVITKGTTVQNPTNATNVAIGWDAMSLNDAVASWLKEQGADDATNR